MNIKKNLNIEKQLENTKIFEIKHILVCLTFPLHFYLLFKKYNQFDSALCASNRLFKPPTYLSLSVSLISRLEVHPQGCI